MVPITLGLLNSGNVLLQEKHLLIRLSAKNKMQVVLTIVVTLLFFCIEDSVAQPRPVFPQYTFIPMGSFVCKGTGGVCDLKSKGFFRAWWEFDDKGVFMNYREDAILGDDNGTLVYEREYTGGSEGRFYFLANDTSTTLECVSFNLTISFTCDYLKGAKYEGIRTVRDKRVYTYLSQWKANGELFNVTTWVADDQPDRIFGFASGVMNYYYTNVLDVKDGFKHPVFTPPNVQCTNEAAALRSRRYSNLAARLTSL